MVKVMAIIIAALTGAVGRSEASGPCITPPPAPGEVAMTACHFEWPSAPAASAPKTAAPLKARAHKRRRAEGGGGVANADCSECKADLKRCEDTAAELRKVIKGNNERIGELKKARQGAIPAATHPAPIPIVPIEIEVE